MLILYVQKIVLGGEATSLNRMLLYRDCNLNLLSLHCLPIKRTNKLCFCPKEELNYKYIFLIMSAHKNQSIFDCRQSSIHKFVLICTC